jgi:aspartyl-tRNA(Asn)/glutamyl-tRNA(Gln) amidotransferase subunit B
MDYTVVIGLEVHVQLLTKTKLYCGCANLFNPDNPNVQTCPVCLGLPGSLPVLNKRAVELAVRTGLALNLDISQYTKWDRKQYYYPDLPKNYQISQYDLPITHDGWLEIEVNPDTGERKRVGIIRAHLEEDAGKNMHDERGRGDSQVDLNRAGTPLLEIVSKPDIRSAAEARKYLEELKLLLLYLGVSDCNMQEGSLRCDANVNLHVHTDDGHNIPTPITEIKNVNSFRNVELAITSEVERQFEDYKRTGKKLGDPGASKETRGFNAATGKTFAQRGKEDAHDYRYFPEPDLCPVTFTEDQIQAVRESLIEFPADRRTRMQAAYQISSYDAAVIVDQQTEFADFYETVAKGGGDGKQAANWMTQDVLREMNDRKLTIGTFPIRPDVLCAILKKINQGDITIKAGRDVFMALLEDASMGTDVIIDPERVDRIIAEKGLAIVKDTGAIETAIAAAIAKNEKAVADFKSGKQAAVGKLIGEVMKQCKGADPQTVRTMLMETLAKA